MLHEGKIWVGTAGENPVYLLPGMANRHGLIAGATGTGKTVSLKVLAESFSDMGAVPKEKALITLSRRRIPQRHTAPSIRTA